MELSPNLNLPYIMPSQAQKHVTHNEAIKQLDAIVQLAVISSAQNTPPTAQQEHDRYIIANNPTGEWAQYEHNVAIFQDGAWQFLLPKAGWRAWVNADNILIVWNGTAWITASVHDHQNLPNVGINSSADNTNRFAVRAPASLFNHEGADHQVKINKYAPSDTASLLFQSNFTGHAEMGLTGDNDFHIKISDDGQNWRNALHINAQSGLMSSAALRSGTVTVNDDSLSTIDTPHIGGLVCVLIINDINPQLSHSGIFAYAAGTTLALSTLSSAADLDNQTTTPLSGTTGIDGKSSISVSNGQLQIENRSGSTQIYSYTFIG